ncbi:MAG: PorT family protein [Parabacteroides distasonis]|nr:PorT family protein [Parabacteroides distasonis]
MKGFRTFLLVALLLLGFQSAKSQLRWGLKGGVNISTVHFNSDLFKADNVTGFHIGPMIEGMVPGVGLGFDAAILYSQKGVEMKTEGISSSVKTDYVDVPVNLKWKFGMPLVKAYLAAGPYVGFRVGGDKFWDVPGNILGQVKAKSFGAGVNFGAGIELIKYLQVGFQYSLGLTDNYSVDKFDLETKNRGWSISVAILF